MAVPGSDAPEHERLDPTVYLKMLALGLLAYGVVAATELRKIRKIPMNEALKNAE